MTVCNVWGRTKSPKLSFSDHFVDLCGFVLLNYINIHSLGQASQGTSAWGRFQNVDGLGKKKKKRILYSMGRKKTFGMAMHCCKCLFNPQPRRFSSEQCLAGCSKEGGALERKHPQGNKVKAPWSHWQLLSMCSCNVVSPNSSCSGNYGTLSEFQL